MKKIIIVVCVLISILYSFTFSYAINPIIGDVVKNPEETEPQNEDNLIEVSIYTEIKDVILKDIFAKIFTEKL